MTKNQNKEYSNQIEEYRELQRKAEKRLKSTNYVNFKKVGTKLRNEIQDLFEKYKIENDCHSSSQSRAMRDAFESANGSRSGPRGRGPI